MCVIISPFFTRIHTSVETGDYFYYYLYTYVWFSVLLFFCQSYGRSVELEDSRILALVESGSIHLTLGSYKKVWSSSWLIFSIFCYGALKYQNIVVYCTHPWSGLFLFLFCKVYVFWYRHRFQLLWHVYFLLICLIVVETI